MGLWGWNGAVRLELGLWGWLGPSPGQDQQQLQPREGSGSRLLESH